MTRRLYTARGVRTLRSALLTADEAARIAESAREVIEPEQLHRCRWGRAAYDWRATATVGRFVCRGCGISALCGACADLAGQRVPPGVVPALCALHGGLLEIGVTTMALAVGFPAPVMLPAREKARERRMRGTPERQETLLAVDC